MRQPGEKIRVRNYRCPWINKDIIKLMKVRDVHEKYARKDKSQASRQHYYKILRNKVYCALKRSKASYVSQKLSESTDNIWQTLKKIIPESKDNLPNSVCMDGRDIIDNNKIATKNSIISLLLLPILL